MLILVGGGLLFGPQAASAQTCIQDVWQAHGNKQGLQCTANDVTLGTVPVESINILTGGECVIENGQRVCRCFAGETVTFTAVFQMNLGADTRYDVGFYLATDGDPNNDGAITGQCTATASLASNTPAANFINLDAAPDVCGDITGPLNTAHNPLFVTAQITTQCPLTGTSLPLDFATTWRQPGDNQVCSGTGNGTTTNDVFPGSPSKCNTGTVNIPIQPVPVAFTLSKTAVTTTVSEAGGAVTYNVTITNNTPLAITLTTLTDNPYGDITTVHGDPTLPLSVTQTSCVPDADPATCQVGGSIAAGGSCSCTFTGNVPPGDFVPGASCGEPVTPFNCDASNPQIPCPPTPILPGCFPDTVTTCAINVSNPTPPGKCRVDAAAVRYLDVPQAPVLTKAVGGKQCQIDVTYNVVVTNNVGNDPTPGVLTLNTLNDDKYGNITVVQGNVISTNCAVPQNIQPGLNYSCSFVGRISSCNTTLTDVVQGTATDDEGQTYPTPTVPLNGTATVVLTCEPPPAP
jgi:hypothetical protein